MKLKKIHIRLLMGLLILTALSQPIAAKALSGFSFDVTPAAAAEFSIQSTITTQESTAINEEDTSPATSGYHGLFQYTEITLLILTGVIILFSAIILITRKNLSEELEQLSELHSRHQK